MAQHTGQHLLSAALLRAAGAETSSARLGEATSTIDVAAPSLDEGALHRAEDLTNDVILDDLPIRVLFPSPDELAALPLRRAPKVQEGVRVIEVAGFDCSPCGGTHCARTGQVGPVRISSIERYKGLFRVTFLAGRRALADHRRKDDALRELARGMSCGPFDVGGAIEKLRADLRERSEQLGNARGELVRLVAERALAAAPPIPGESARLVIAREGDDLGALRALAAALARRPDVVALVASRPRDGGDWLVAIERGADASFDAGAWLKDLARRHGGRGGGRPERAEGRLPGSVDWLAVAATS
jgi:alanyl-tRNA synthetase